MKNKIVQLRDGKTTCRILDSIVHNGNTMYVVIDFNSKSITTIHPKDIWDIVERDTKDLKKFLTIKDCIIEKGL